jgi:hypothetical protein
MRHDTIGVLGAKCLRHVIDQDSDRCFVESFFRHHLSPSRRIFVRMERSEMRDQRLCSIRAVTERVPRGRTKGPQSDSAAE